MAMHNTNSLLKYIVPVVAFLIVILLILPLFNKSDHTNDTQQKSSQTQTNKTDTGIKNNADHDSAAESLETLTAELSETKKVISDVSKNNDNLKRHNDELQEKLSNKEDDEKSQISNEIQQLKDQIQTLKLSKTEPQYNIDGVDNAHAITTVTDLSKPDKNDKNSNPLALFTNSNNDNASIQNTDEVKEHEEDKAVPYYTIPANATSVKDLLMTPLVGRIPIKGIVTDPYPFKIVISDDNLAANGLRVPHLLQMIVSGYCEGDLNLMSVRGWVTSLTFVFDDGTISTTTSNDNDIGNFTKSNSLGYLSDERGNPFISGKLKSNAPTYLGINAGLGTSTGLANAYSMGQTTTTSSPIDGTSSTSVTGSQTRFVAGQSLSGGMNEAAQWWHDREQNSFDAIYVPTVDECGNPIKIAVNFAKEIHIDYNPKGRKLSYAYSNSNLRAGLD